MLDNMFDRLVMSVLKGGKLFHFARVQMYHKVMPDIRKLPRLQLVAVVCYYGKHYSTFVFHSKLKTWIYFDDATVREVSVCIQHFGLGSGLLLGNIWLIHGRGGCLFQDSCHSGE